jgi:hypothetical protein
MSPEQSTVDEFVDRTAAVSTLFRLSDDPFVNEAAAEISRELANEGLVTVTSTQIKIVDGTDVERLADWIESLFEEVLEATHCRTTVAHRINAVLDDLGSGTDDDRRIPTPTTYFPEPEDDLTVFADDQVSEDALDNAGVPHDEIEYVGNDTSSLYKLSPTYVGTPSGFQFQRYQYNRYRRYLDTYLTTLRGEFEADDPACMLCGSVKMPTTKGLEGDDLDFNQSFNIQSTASGTSTPLGMGGRTTSHSGRCVACLLAGFYYTLMPKLVRFKSREPRGGSYEVPIYNVFAPRGGFNELVEIRSDFSQDLLTWIDEPTSNGRARRGTLSAVSTPSRGLQVLQFYEAVLRYVNKEVSRDYYEYTVENHPTALVGYATATMKSGNPIRDIAQIESIDPGTWGYTAVRQRSIPTDNEDSEYWPFDDLLEWYARLDDDDVGVATLDDLAFGILNRDLQRLERGHFEVAKTLEQTQGRIAPYVLPIRRASNYFSHIMEHTTTTVDRIDEEAIESIKRVGSNIGQTFYERDDISVLISLQNASTSDKFLAAFEKASIQAQKKASAGDGGTDSWSGNNDVAQVLELIADPETFEPAKRMFVIHASLSAQYMNAQRGDTGGDQ